MTDFNPNREIDGPALLAEWLEAGCKPESDWRLGTEHEKFGFIEDSLKPLPHDGPQSITAVLEGLQQFGWRPVVEGNALIGLQDAAGCSVSLEPGGQLELSGAPRENLHQTCNEVNEHLRQVKAVSQPLGIGFLGLGFHPKWPRKSMQWMPKARYRIMREYMPRVGSLGLDMMSRTCTVQVNLDYSDEADMVRKFRVALALQPVATALFANSPFVEGQPSGWLSYRAHIWSDTDPHRTGMLPWVFESGMGFERYVDWVLDVPMYFVRRDGRYLDVAGHSFRDFMAGRLPGLGGEIPTLADWEDHLSTAFPEVRLKRFLEMRGADGGPWNMLCALPALWVGLLYHSPSLDAAWARVKDWSAETREILRQEVPRTGLATEVDGIRVSDLAREVLELAREGLSARNQLNTMGDNETGFLNSLDDIVRSEQTPAEKKLLQYREEWNQQIDPLFQEYAY